MRGGTGMRRRDSTGGGTGGGAGAFGAGAGAGGWVAVFISETHWLTRLVVSPIFSSAIFNPFNWALARETRSPAAAPIAPRARICCDGGAGTVGRSRES